MATKAKARKAVPAKKAAKKTQSRVTPGARETATPVKQIKQRSDKELDSSIQKRRQEGLPIVKGKDSKTANVVHSAGLDTSTSETNRKDKNVEQVADPMQQTLRDAEAKRLEEEGK